MDRHKLFLLQPGFKDEGQGPFYCPECAQLTGLLEFYPELREKLDIRFIDFAKPRSEIVELIGPDNQGCPVLVLAAPQPEHLRDLPVGTFQGRQFIEGANEIGLYLSRAYGVGRPH